MKKVPRRRFGRTNIMMPVISCGGMRLQETWVPHEGFELKDVSESSMRNMTETIRAALKSGINHFETAQGYGCSELMYGRAFKMMLNSSEIEKRNDIIIQTKVKPCATEKEFRKLLDKSLSALDLEGNGIKYIDLMSLHGINKPNQLEWAVKICIPVLKEYQKKGIVKWIGFSTHAMTPVICDAIKTNHFDYINLHYHFIGSYTASGSSEDGNDNLSALREARKRDMGVFIISAQDKGGMLYKPPEKFVRLTSPLTPMEFNTLYLLSLCEEDTFLIHTLVVGAARPSDFEEHVRAVTRDASVSKLVKSATMALQSEFVRVHGEDWSSKWWKGLTDCYQNEYGIHISMIVWLWNITQAWGLLHYARGRYAFMEDNAKKWSLDKSSKPEEKMSKLFDWNPGCALLEENRVPKLFKYLTHCEAKSPKEIECLLRDAHRMFAKDAPSRMGDKKWGNLVNSLSAKFAFDLQKGNVPIPDRPNCARPRDVLGIWKDSSNDVSLDLRTDGTWTLRYIENKKTLSGNWKCCIGDVATKSQRIELISNDEPFKMNLKKSRGENVLVGCDGVRFEK